MSIEDKDGCKFVLPREIDDVPAATDDEGSDKIRYGFLAMKPTDGSLEFDDRPSDYPEDWLEYDAQGEPRMKPAHRSYRAQRVHVDATGQLGAGNPGWFLPGKFRFCLACKTLHSAQGKDNNRLASLSDEGRSSATTLFTNSVLRWMNQEGAASIRPIRRKLLGFTDNRQDAALQAGHFNDFLFVSLLRAGMLGAVTKVGDDGLTSDRLGQAMVKALGFDRTTMRPAPSGSSIPSSRGAALLQAQRSLREVLAYRAWIDQRRGWRFNNPNIEQLGWLTVEYEGLNDLVHKDDVFAGAPDFSRRPRRTRASLHLPDSSTCCDKGWLLMPSC